MSYSQIEMYTKLKGYLPEYYDNILEFNKMLDSESYEIKDTWDGIENAIQETFLNDCTEYGIKRWESILNIKPSITWTLEQRRNILKSKLFIKTKATLDYIKSLGESHGTIEMVEFSASSSTVILYYSKFNGTELLFKKIRETIPAHLLFDIQIEFSKSLQIQSRRDNYKFNYSPCGNTLCGTAPLINTIGRINSNNLEVGASSESYLFDYILCGTVPIDSTLGRINQSDVITYSNSNGYLFKYIPCGTTLCGTKP